MAVTGTGKRTRQRGRCPGCGYRMILRADGSVGSHLAPGMMIKDLLTEEEFDIKECRGVGHWPVEDYGFENFDYEQYL